MTTILIIWSNELTRLDSVSEAKVLDEVMETETFITVSDLGICTYIDEELLFLIFQNALRLKLIIKPFFLHVSGFVRKVLFYLWYDDY